MLEVRPSQSSTPRQTSRHHGTRWEERQQQVLGTMKSLAKTGGKVHTRLELLLCRSLNHFRLSLYMMFMLGACEELGACLTKPECSSLNSSPVLAWLFMRSYRSGLMSFYKDAYLPVQERDPVITKTQDHLKPAQRLYVTYWDCQCTHQPSLKGVFK